MSTRPPILFPLFAGIETLDGVGPRTAKHLAALDITRPRDLLFTLPWSGVDRTRRATVQGAPIPGVVTVEVVVGRHDPPARPSAPYRVVVEDAATSFHLVFFRARADYLRKLLPTGARRVVSGKVELFDGIAQMVHPDHVLPVEEACEIPAFEPVYPLTAGLTQRAMAGTIIASAVVSVFTFWAASRLSRAEGRSNMKGSSSATAWQLEVLGPGQR